VTMPRFTAQQGAEWTGKWSLKDSDTPLIACLRPYKEIKTVFTLCNIIFMMTRAYVLVVAIGIWL